MRRVTERQFIGAVFAYQALVLVAQLGVFWNLPNRNDSTFEGVGVLASVDQLAVTPYRVVFVVTVGAAVIAALSWWRVSDDGPLRLSRPWLRAIATVASAVGFLVLTTARASFGQLLWFDNLPALHGVGIALATLVTVGVASGPPVATIVRWCALVSVVTYFVAGVAKLRYGGIEWLSGETLSNHVAFSATRLEVFGATRSPVADVAQSLRPVAPVAAIATLLSELCAPAVLIRPTRIAGYWCLAMMTLHLAIAASMFVVFPYHLVGLAVLPVWLCHRKSHLVQEGRSSAS
jgi:hypothetical protein